MARWTRGVGAVVMLVVFGTCDGGHPWTKSPEDRGCREASEAMRWKEAATACTRAAERSDRSDETIVLAARALQRQVRREDALAMATRGLGTAVDATARQIAGSLLEELNRHREAQLLLSQAVIGHRMAGDHAQLARDLQVMTGWFRTQRRLTEALDAANQSLVEATRARDARLIGSAHRAQAAVLTVIGDGRAARDAYVDAESELRPWPEDLAWALLGHGILLNDLDNPKVAVQLLTEALELANRVGIPRVAAAATLNLALGSRMLGDTAAAQRYLDALPRELRGRTGAAFVSGMLAADRGEVALAEQRFAEAAADAPDDDFSWDIAYHRGLFAEQAGDFAAAEASYRAAIAIVDRIRTRTKAIEMRPWVLAPRRNPYEALFVLRASQHRGGDALVVAEQIHAQAWIDALVSAAAPRDRPALESATPEPRPPDELFAAIGDRELLIYLTARGALWRIHVAERRVVELAQISAAAEPLLSSWSEHPDDRDLAEQLGGLLLPGDLAASPHPLYLITPERLAQVPFAALRRSQRVLIADRALVRIPGIAALRCRRREPVTGGAVLVADSRSDRPLPAARREIAHVERVTRGEAFVGSAATISQIARARRASLLHVAVHADVDATGGALLLADGRLTASEILVSGLAPRVAVLAGCATGAGNDVGWGSLPSALLIAGTRSVVATLRPVLDGDAAAVMSEFYEKGGQRDPIGALAAAQRTLSSSSPPHVWAHFAAWGLAESDCPDAL